MIAQAYPNLDSPNRVLSSRTKSEICTERITCHAWRIIALTMSPLQQMATGGEPPAVCNSEFLGFIFKVDEGLAVEQPGSASALAGKQRLLPARALALPGGPVCQPDDEASEKSPMCTDQANQRPGTRGCAPGPARESYWHGPPAASPRLRPLPARHRMRILILAPECPWPIRKGSHARMVGVARKLARAFGSARSPSPSPSSGVISAAHPPTAAAVANTHAHAMATEPDSTGKRRRNSTM